MGSLFAKEPESKPELLFETSRDACRHRQRVTQDTRKFLCQRLVPDLADLILGYNSHINIVLEWLSSLVSYTPWTSPSLVYLFLVAIDGKVVEEPVIITLCGLSLFHSAMGGGLGESIGLGSGSPSAQRYLVDIPRLIEKLERRTNEPWIAYISFLCIGRGVVEYHGRRKIVFPSLPFSDIRWTDEEQEVSQYHRVKLENDLGEPFIGLGWFTRYTFHLILPLPNIWGPVRTSVSSSSR